jgi:hypothetical protein
MIENAGPTNYPFNSPVSERSGCTKTHANHHENMGESVVSLLTFGI